MSDDLLSRFCVESGATFFFLPAFELNQWGVDRRDPGPVCGCWDVSFLMPACNRPLLTALHGLHWLIVLIYPVYHWYNRECYWPVSNEARATVTLITAFFIGTKISSQWRTSLLYMKNDELIVIINITIIINNNIISIIFWPTAVFCFKCISCLVSVDIACMGEFT